MNWLRETPCRWGFHSWRFTTLVEWNCGRWDLICTRCNVKIARDEESYVDMMWRGDPWGMWQTWVWMELQWRWGWLWDVPSYDPDLDQTVGMRTGRPIDEEQPR